MQTVEKITDVILNEFGITLYQIRQKNRNRGLVTARFILVYLLITNAKLERTFCAVFVNKSTWMIDYIIRNFEDRLKFDKELKASYERIQSTLNPAKVNTFELSQRLFELSDSINYKSIESIRKELISIANEIQNIKL
jgi:hypothetical protein